MNIDNVCVSTWYMFTMIFPSFLFLERNYILSKQMKSIVKLHIEKEKNII